MGRLLQELSGLAACCRADDYLSRHIQPLLSPTGAAGGAARDREKHSPSEVLRGV
jgi:hypothetical protein